MNEDSESRMGQWRAKGLTTRLVAEIEIDSSPQGPGFLLTACNELFPVAGFSKQVK